MMVKKKIVIIQALLLLIFLICGGYTAKYFYDTHVSKEQYEELRQEVEDDMPAVGEKGGEEYAANGVLKQYADLYQKNNDMVGWLKIMDTAVDYPVVQYTDNEFYLHRDFYKKNQFCGIPFLDCDSHEESMNSIIYAHNMKNGTMFADVAKYKDRKFYDNHKKIFYDTLYERDAYEIIAVFKTTVGSKNEFRYQDYANMTTHKDFNEYVRRVKELSIYNIDKNATYGDKLITLSTCTQRASNNRIVVVARRITE